MCKAYAADFPIETRMARYHNVYGPRGTWKVCAQAGSADGGWDGTMACYQFEPT